MSPKSWILIALAVLVAMAVGAYVLISSYDYNYLKPRLARAVKEATGRDLTLGGDIKLEISLIPALVLRDISLSNAPWGSRPQMLTVRRAEIEVKLLPLLSGRLVVQRLILTEPDILIEINKDGRSNLPTGRPAPPAASAGSAGGSGPAATASSGQKAPAGGEAAATGGESQGIADLWLKRLAVQHAKVRYLDRRSGRDHELQLRALEAGADSANEKISLDARGRLDQNAFSLDGSVGPLGAAMDPARPWPVDLTLEAAGAVLSLSGSVTDLARFRGLDLAVELQGPDLAGLSKLAGRPLPRLGRYRLAGKLHDPTPGTLQFDGLKIFLADNRLQGWARLVTGKGRPAVQAELNTPRLSLLSLAGPEPEPASAGQDKKSGGQAPAGGKAAAPAAPGAAGGPGERVFSHGIIPLGWMDQLDADVAFSAGKFIAPRLAMENVHLRLRLAGGRLELAPATALLGKGEMDAGLTLRRAGKQDAAFKLRLKIAGCDLAAMLEQLGRDEGLEGVLDCDLELNGSGPASLAGAMAGLSGKMALSISRGRVHQRYIDMLAGGLPPELLRLVAPARDSDGYTAFNCAVAGFAPRKGLAPITALVLDTKVMTLVGRGNVDLRSERLDVGVTPYPKAAPDGQPRPSLGGLLKPLKLAGTLARPRVALDPGRTAQTIGKAIAGFRAGGADGLAAALTTSEGEVIDACAQAKAAARAGRVYSPSLSKQSQTGGQNQQGQTGDKQKSSNPLDELPGALKGLFGQ